MSKTKLIKRTSTSPFLTDINIDFDKKNYNLNEQKNLNNLTTKFFMAITEFYKVSSGNLQQILKLLSILEKQNINNTSNDEGDEEEINIQKNAIINNLKLIISINNRNLNNFYRDSKLILNKIETDRRNQTLKIIRPISENKRKITKANNFNNKTIDCNIYHHKINKLNFSPIDSFALEKDNNHYNKKENIFINLLFKKLLNFKQVIGAYSPQMEKIYMKIAKKIYNEYKNLEKKNQDNYVNSVKNRRRGNSFSKRSVNFCDSMTPGPGDIWNLNEKIKNYKVKNDNYKNKIEELKGKLDSLKSYSNALELTLEDKHVNDNYYYFNYNISQNNEQNLEQLKNSIKNYKNVMKTLENLKELNTKLNEENNRNKTIILKKEKAIKKLDLINKNQKNKLKEYEKIILQNNIRNVNILNNDNGKNNKNENLKLNQNIFLSLNSEFLDKNDIIKYNSENKDINNIKKESEIISLKSLILKLKNSNKKLIEYEKVNDNYKSLLVEKEKQINIYEKEIKELKNKNEIKYNYKIINSIKIIILGSTKQKKSKENEYKIKYEKKEKEINSLKIEYINKINSLNSIISNNNQIIQSKDDLINELKLNLINNSNDKDNSLISQKKKLEEKISELKLTNENLKKSNSELIQIKESNNIINQKNKDIIRELNKDKLLLEKELEDIKNKNDILSKEIIELKYKIENETIRVNGSNLKGSYNKKVSKTHNELVKKVNKLENEILNKDQELDGLKKFIFKLQKEKEDMILNQNNINDLEKRE